MFSLNEIVWMVDDSLLIFFCESFGLLEFFEYLTAL